MGKTFHYYLSDIPRSLRFPAVLAECGYYTDATGGGKGKREKSLEFGIRLHSGNNLAVDFVGEKEFRTPFPHLIIKTPGMVHYSKVNDPREIFFLVYPESSIPFLRETGFTTDFSYLPLPDPERIRVYAKQIAELGADRFAKGVSDRIDLLAFQLLGELFLAEANPKETGYYDEKILRIASCFRSRFREKIQLDALLKEYGLSRRTFFRYWSKRFSITPKTYLEELRFQEAAHLLTKTDLPVSAIAEQLQYPSLSYFCEHFKRRFRMTPRQIRKQNKTFC